MLKDADASPEGAAAFQALMRETEAEYREYRVVVDGQASELPIRWIYYLVADKHGRRVVFAFVVEQRLMEAFGDADRRLLATVRLVDPKVASKPGNDSR